VYLNGELTQLEEDEFNVEKNDINYRGVISVEPQHKRNFVFQNGETFIPIGQNVCWFTSRVRKTFDYDVWFSKM